MLTKYTSNTFYRASENLLELSGIFRTVDNSVTAWPLLSLKSESTDWYIYFNYVKHFDAITTEIDFGLGWGGGGVKVLLS